MGGGKASATGTIAAATIYTGGRITTNTLAWAQSLVSLGVQVVALKALLDKQKHAYDDIANKQIGFVETALNEYILNLNNTLLPTFEEAYPDVPQAAPYVEPDLQLVGFQSMVDALTNMPKTEEYVVRVNTLLRYDHIARMNLLQPGFFANLALVGSQIKDLLEGRMSTGDMVEILTDEAERAALTGRIGATTKTTHRNLGISRMRAQKAGRDAMAENAQSLNANISPISREATIHEHLLRPENRMAMALQVSQLVQNALQNIYNTAAQKPPFKLAQLQAKMSASIARLTYSANKGNMVNQFVPNYAAVFGPAIQNLLTGVNSNVLNDKTDTLAHPQNTHPGENPAVT